MFKTSIKKTSLWLLCAAFAGGLPAARALAHDIVLVPERGGVTLRYGHAQDWQPVDERKLIEFQAFTGDLPARDLTAALAKRGLDLLLPAAQMAAGQPLLVAARYDNGLWARLPAVDGAQPGARNTSRVMLPGATLVTNNLKFAKAISSAPADQALFKRPLGHLLELLPQRNPATLKPGEALDVLVLFQGQPLAGAGIEVSNLKDKIAEDQIRRYTTDSQGIARVTLHEKGVNMLGVDLERPNDGSLGEASRAVGADKFVIVATYTFVR